MIYTLSCGHVDAKTIEEWDAAIKRPEYVARYWVDVNDRSGPRSMKEQLVDNSAKRAGTEALEGKAND